MTVDQKLLIPESLILDPEEEFLQGLTIGDLMTIDLDSVIENHKPYSFFIHYSTVKGDALGKLILTDQEIIFDPLNKNLKGFINQESELKRRRFLLE